MGRRKRRRGGQPGNQNARKHGLYARNMSPEQISALCNTPDLQSKDPVLLALQLKVRGAITARPDNPRVIREGSALLAKYCGASLGLDKELSGFLKKAFRATFKAAATGDMNLTNRIILEIQEQVKNLPDD